MNLSLNNVQSCQTGQVKHVAGPGQDQMDYICGKPSRFTLYGFLLFPF